MLLKNWWILLRNPCQTESVDMGLCVKGQKFVRLIGTVQYLILLVKHNILSKVTAPCLMNDIYACLQNLIVKGVFSVHNLLSSMCSKLSIEHR